MDKSEHKEECQTLGWGDSGGPLVCRRTEFWDSKWYLLGAVSYGKDCKYSKETPGVYASIFNMRSWIVDTHTYYQYQSLDDEKDIEFKYAFNSTD